MTPPPAAVPAFTLLHPRAKPAIVWRDTPLSYSDLLTHAAALAALYPSAPGDRVVIFSENRPEWIAALYAIWRNRGVVVPVDAFSPAGEVAYILEQTGPVAAFCSSKTLPVLKDALRGLPELAPQILCFDVEEFPPVPFGAGLAEPLASGAADELAAILYTSGTTGAPKGVMLNFGNLLTNLESVCDRVPIFRPESRIFALLPLHHILPLMGCILAPLYSGGTIVLAHSLDPAEMISTMKQHRVTILIGVPRLYALFRKAIIDKLFHSPIGRLLYRLSAAIGRLGVSRVLLRPVQKKFGGSLRQMVSGGAPLDRAVARDLAICGFEILEGYGMTECAPMITFPRPGAIRLGSCGNPCLPDSVRIENGEVLARGPHVFPGYWKNPDATAEAIQDGWLHTGDVGYLDSDNYLFITGRKKEIIVLPNGKKVNPAELEDKLMTLSPDIKDVAVTFRDDLLHALIQPVSGFLGGVPAQQAEHFRWNLLEPYNRLAPPAKKITQLTIVSVDLPKTRLGKLKRHELAALAVGTFSGDSTPEPKPADLGPAYVAFDRFLRTELECLRVSPGAHWEMDLALDSLARLSVLVFIEKTFGVKLPESVFQEYPTVLALAKHADENRIFFRQGAGAWDSLLKARPEDPQMDLPRSTWVHPFLKTLLGCLLRLCFRVRAEGQAHLPTHEPCILVANHQSYIDGLFVSMFLTNPFLRRTYYYAKRKHVKKGLLEWLAGRCNVIVVEVGRDVQISIQMMVQAVRRGGNLLIFPEGTRSADGQIGDFRSTFAAMALELDVPVIPVAISGAIRALPRGKRLPRFLTRVTVRFLPRMSADNRTSEVNLAEATRELIAQHLS
ncbi:MAG TPA: AMP-binding protein [Kiritimatiellia bacterium]|jgi:long-chain acyl-CoA synthetase|nr:AMP-binding protein [Kiritimatiellia bacterium]HQN80499.1 AMP-binding protein [Kiritimatiellia bacterium]